MKELKITLVQTFLNWEDVDANINHFNNVLHTLNNTDVIVLPEMFTTGFSMNTLKCAKDSYEKGLQFMHSLASRKSSAICGSLMCEEKGKYYNRLVWVQPDGIVKYYNKRHLFTMGDEDKHYEKGIEQLTIEYKNWKIKPLICYDLRFPVWSRSTASNSYDVLLYCANWPEKRSSAWTKLLQARAIENSCYVVGVNRIGEDGNGYVYNGNSMVVDFKGEPEILENREEVIRTFTLNKQALDEFRIQFPMQKDADDFKVMF